jgi:hypothetical protein
MEEEQENKEKKFSWKNNISLWFVIALIIFFVAFFAIRHFTRPDYVNTFELPEGEEEIFYNNFKFVKLDNMWYTQWQKGEKLYTIPLRFNPYEAEKVPTEGALNVTLFNSVQGIYVTFDLSDENNSNFSLMALASTELTQNLVKAINRVPIAACTNNESYACEGRPIVTCDNNTIPVILIQEKAPAKIIFDGNCMILQGEGMELLKPVDKILYQWYGIIK